jgi:hypothetical protein
MFPKVMRGDYTIGLNLTGNGLDDPDHTLYVNFTCGAERNYDRYCIPGARQDGRPAVAIPRYPMSTPSSFFNRTVYLPRILPSEA